MHHDNLTYGQLRHKLEALGYRQRSVRVDGKTGVAFEHEQVKGARILLPDFQDDTVVEPFYLNYILTVLKEHGLVEEVNPLRA